MIKRIDEQEKIFKDYTDKFIKSDDAKKNSYIDKQNHSIFVMQEALLIDETFTKYNEQFKRLLGLESLFHDIGRFNQLKVSGTFHDNEISKFYSEMKDHGDLGAEVIKSDGLLDKLIPNIRIYDDEIENVIRLHSKINPGLLNNIELDYISAINNYDLYELFTSRKSTKEREILTSVNTAIVQDVDRLDIFRKIIKGIWVPTATNEIIDPELFELFKKGQLPTINQIKAMGKWNTNVGHLVRMSFINQMNLVPVLQKIKEENLIENVFLVSGNPYVEQAYEFAAKQLDDVISNSKDGVLVLKK